MRKLFATLITLGFLGAGVAFVWACVAVEHFLELVMYLISLGSLGLFGFLAYGLVRVLYEAIYDSLG